MIAWYSKSYHYVGSCSKFHDLILSYGYTLRLSFSVGVGAQSVVFGSDLGVGSWDYREEFRPRCSLVNHFVGASVYRSTNFKFQTKI